VKYETILFEKEDHICIITLNRPQRLNALSMQLIDELSKVVDDIEADDEIRVAIITGASRQDGRPCFSAGVDIKEIAEKGIGSVWGQKPDIVRRIEGLYKYFDVMDTNKMRDKLEKMSKPLIAAIDGVCAAGGLETAMCADIILVAETARIMDPHIPNLGMVGGGGITTRMVRLIGAQMAKEMAFTGEPIDGKEAWRIGFANHVYPSEKLMEEAKKLARKIAEMRPVAIRLAKASCNASIDLSLDEALRHSYLCAIASMVGAGEEGFKAFSEKRDPTFRKGD